MKKRALLFVFLIIFAFLTTSCANQPLFALKNNNSQDIYMSSIYLSFEDSIALSSHFLKAELSSQEEIENNTVYNFVVQENYFGTETPTVIAVRKCIGETIPYEQGQSYYLLLQHRGSALDGDFYITSGSDLLLPADNLSNAVMHGESLLKHSKLSSLKKENDFVTYVLDYFKDNNIPEDRYFGRPFIKSDKIEDIVLGSELVLRIRIDEDVSTRGMTVRAENRCTVTEVLKGDVEIGQEILIIFLKDSVAIGEEYIVTLNSNPHSIMFALSSKLGIYDVSRQEEILQYLTAENTD